MTDVETLDEEEPIVKPTHNGDFPSMSMDLFKKINFKIAIFLYIIGLFLFSDIFINGMLSSYSELGCPNTQGTVIQLTLLTIAYIVVDLLAQGGLI